MSFNHSLGPQRSKRRRGEEEINEYSSKEAMLPSKISDPAKSCKKHDVESMMDNLARVEESLVDIQARLTRLEDRDFATATSNGSHPTHQKRARKRTNVAVRSVRYSFITRQR